MPYLPWIASGVVLLIAWIASVEYRLHRRKSIAGATRIHVPEMRYAENSVQSRKWDAPTNIVRSAIQRSIDEEQEDLNNAMYLSDEQRRQ